MKKILLLLLIGLSYSTSSIACSAIFVKKDVMVFGKNFDWYNGEGMVLKNNRGIKKTAYGIDQENIASWTSKYGSLTFNQVGKEFPYGGLNEKGLAVEMLWLSSTQYEENEMSSLSELEWIQYQLDNFKTVAEIIQAIDSVNINPITANLHYFVADRGGRSAVIEFLNGKVNVFKTHEEFQVATNSIYPNSEDYFLTNKNNVDFESKSSLDRYSQLRSKVHSPKARYTEGMFEVLNKSAEERENYKTYWSIVYDLKNSIVSFKTFDNQKVKSINMEALNFDNNSPLYFMDINSKMVQFGLLTKDINKQYLTNALKSSNIYLNIDRANEHMMNPEKALKDDIYSTMHKDLTIVFNIKKNKGNIFYTLTSGEEDFKKFKGDRSGILSAKSDTARVVLYSLKIGEYAIASFHDFDKNNKMNSGLFGIPSEPFAFSNNAKGFFGPPTYNKAKFKSDQPALQEIDIK